jgi:tetratricopeptide (TPR) repeat protein
MSDQVALEEERDFLLRSLDDLEAERTAGNIDDETYQTLHQDYTARAAAVIRSLRDDVEPELPQAPRPSRTRKVVTFVLVATFAGVTAFGLSQALGTRGEGDTITGNTEGDDDATAAALETLRVAAEDNPDDFDARIAYARALLGSDLADALRQFDAAAQIDPNQPEPPTYIGWINALAARELEAGADRDALLARAQDFLGLAIDLDPEYQDAYVYRALVTMNLLNDPAGAIPDFQQFLRIAPTDHPMRELVTSALAEATSATGATTTPTTVASP